MSSSVASLTVSGRYLSARCPRRAALNSVTTAASSVAMLAARVLNITRSGRPPPLRARNSASGTVRDRASRLPCREWQLSSWQVRIRTPSDPDPSADRMNCVADAARAGDLDDVQEGIPVVTRAQGRLDCGGRRTPAAEGRDPRGAPHVRGAVRGHQALYLCALQTGDADGGARAFRGADAAALACGRPHLGPAVEHHRPMRAKPHAGQAADAASRVDGGVLRVPHLG